MDSSTIKVLLDSQERTYKTALDLVVKQMSEHINKLENKVSDLTTSLEFTQSEVDNLKTNARELNKERKEDKTTIEKLVQKVKELEEKVIYQEDYSRRKNIRISGLEEQSNETWEQTSATVTSLLETKLQLPGVVLERAHRVGPPRDDKPSTVVARFTRYGDRDAAIRRGSRLRGTNIFLNEDMSSASLAIKNAQMPMFKQARAEGKLAFFRHTRLIIRERTEDNTRRQRQTSVSEGGAVSGAVVDGRDEAGPAAGGAVTNTQVAGVWSGGSGGGNIYSSPSLAHQGGSRQQSPAALSLRNPTKKTRSSTKK